MGNITAIVTRWNASESEKEKEQEHKEELECRHVQKKEEAEVNEQENTNKRIATNKRSREINANDDDNDANDTKMCALRCKCEEESDANTINGASVINDFMCNGKTIVDEDVLTLKSTWYAQSEMSTQEASPSKYKYYYNNNNSNVTSSYQARQEKALCQCVCYGNLVERTYGCHYHLYETASPAESHGVALGWSLRQQPLSVYSLLTLGRVANSCHKKVALIGDSHDVVVLKYTGEL